MLNIPATYTTIIMLIKGVRGNLGGDLVRLEP